MTFIQPRETSHSMQYILAGLSCAAFAGTFWLVMLYNNIVTLHHNISAAREDLDSISAESTALNNKIIAALGNIQSDSLATQDGLVEDNHPQYFSLHQSWPLASQR